MEVARLLVAALAVATLGGCSAATRYPDDADTDEPAPGPVGAVDLLFVVDRGCAGAALLHELQRHAGLLVRELLDPSVDPATGEAPRSVRDLHVGLTSMSADMAGFRTGFCDEVDDGRLLFPTPRTCEPEPGADCPSPPWPWLAHSEGSPDLGDDPADPPIWDDLACLLDPESRCGCGWQQPLEAALRALTLRHGPGEPNAGFLREESVLALVFLADGDDCSVADPAMFDPAREDLGPISTRCALSPERLRPVAHYVDALRSLRPAMADRTVVALFGGLPPDGSWRPGDPVEELASWVRVDPADPSTLVPVCDWRGGLAFAPPRMVELAYGLGGGEHVVSSICGADWDSSEAMVETARAVLRRTR